jgi:hypothetical protein
VTDIGMKTIVSDLFCQTRIGCKSVVWTFKPSGSTHHVTSEGSSHGNLTFGVSKYDSYFTIMQIFGIGCEDNKPLDLQLQFEPSNVFYEHIIL